MNEDPLAQALATTTFDPEDFAITWTWLSPPFRPTADGAPAMITVGLNSDDLSYAYVALDPPGRRLVAGVWKDTDFTNSVWLDMRPAEALELGRRLQICAEAAARFAEAFPEEPDEADSTDERLATKVGTNSDTYPFPPDQAT